MTPSRSVRGTTLVPTAATTPRAAIELLNYWRFRTQLSYRPEQDEPPADAWRARDGESQPGNSVNFNVNSDGRKAVSRSAVA